MVYKLKKFVFLFKKNENLFILYKIILCIVSCYAFTKYIFGIFQNTQYNKMFVILFFSLFFIFSFRASKLSYSNKNLKCILFIFIYICINIIGYCLYKYDSINIIFLNTYNFIKCIIVIIGLTYIIYNILKVVMWYMHKTIQDDKNENNKQYLNKIYMLFFVWIFIADIADKFSGIYFLS